MDRVLRFGNNHKILIIGNACSGKTNLSQFIAKKLDIPITHVDSIQFDQNLNMKPYKETTDHINHIMMNNKRWLIDGYGPLDNLIHRFDQADWIILIDLPLWVNYYWAFKRQIKNIFLKSRPELPKGSSERGLQHTLKLFKTIHQIHHKMRPELLRILNREHYKNKTSIISSKKQYKSQFNTSND